ncbi:major facilitator superfamily domain-containing protein, partial [Xylariales sp. PMI_506]
LSLFVGALDVSIVATAAPTISAELSSASGYTWIGASFILANVSTCAIWVKLSDIWGRKIILMVLLVWFAASSVVCATAKSIEMLIAGRALQGAACGGLILLVHVCISDLFSLRQRSLFLGLTEGVWALAGGIGPVLGGVFSSLLTWRWCFWINLPFSGLAACIIFFFLDIKHEHTSLAAGMRAVDWMGILTFLGCSLMLMLGLDFGGDVLPWNSTKVIVLLAVGGSLVFAFIYSEVKLAKYPLIPMNIFNKKRKVATLLLAFFHGFTFMSAEYYIPLYLQSALGASPLQSGLLLLPFIVTTAISGIICGAIIHRTGRYRELIWIGSILLCIGLGLFIMFSPQTTVAQVIGYQIIGGIGSGLLFESPVIAIQSQVGPEDMATATSTINFIRNVAIALSVVVGGSLVQNSMSKQTAAFISAGLPEDLIQQFSEQNALANVLAVKAIPNETWRLVVEDAFCSALRNLWILSAAIAAAGVLTSLFIGQSHLSTEHTETVTGLKK